MGTFLDRSDKLLFVSVPPDELPEPLGNYILEPDLSAVIGFPSKYWTISGDDVLLKSQAERDQVDADEATDRTAQDRAARKQEILDNRKDRALIKIIADREGVAPSVIRNEWTAAMDVV